MSEPIRHGGNLREAARRYSIPLEDWLDLSTGINPLGFPVPPVPPDAWRRLPEDDDGLAETAARYYGAKVALPVAGSQAAIRALPTLLTRGTAAVAPLTYGEYAPAFERAGHRVVPLDVSAHELPSQVDHAIVANPNNPTAERIPRETLLRWHSQLAKRNRTRRWRARRIAKVSSCCARSASSSVSRAFARASCSPPRRCAPRSPGRSARGRSAARRVTRSKPRSPTALGNARRASGLPPTARVSPR
jgi:hypothetical protein